MVKGGKRKGAGRPPKDNAEKKQTICMTFSPIVEKYLRSTGEPSAAVEKLIRKSKDFKEFERRENA